MNGKKAYGIYKGALGTNVPSLLEPTPYPNVMVYRYSKTQALVTGCLWAFQRAAVEEAQNAFHVSSVATVVGR